MNEKYQLLGASSIFKRANSEMIVFLRSNANGV